jgi:hypothetical protein
MPRMGNDSKFNEERVSSRSSRTSLVLVLIKEGREAREKGIKHTVLVFVTTNL